MSNLTKGQEVKYIYAKKEVTAKVIGFTPKKVIIVFSYAGFHQEKTVFERNLIL